MRHDDRLAAATLDRYPDADTRTLALLCGDRWVPSKSFDAEWNRRGQEIAVAVAEREITDLRLVRSWTAPEFSHHDSFVRDMERWFCLAGWGVAAEASTRVRPTDARARRADLVLGDLVDDGGAFVPLIVVEAKTQVRTVGQAKAAAAQVLDYCRGFDREYGTNPIPVVIAGEIGPKAPRLVDDVQVFSPQEFVDYLGTPHGDAA